MIEEYPPQTCHNCGDVICEYKQKALTVFWKVYLRLWSRLTGTILTRTGVTSTCLSCGEDLQGKRGVYSAVRPLTSAGLKFQDLGPCLMFGPIIFTVLCKQCRMQSDVAERCDTRLRNVLEHNGFQCK